MKLSELRSWCNQATFADDKEIEFEICRGEFVKLKEIVITRTAILFVGDYKK
jgi:hypothetical protein